MTERSSSPKRILVLHWGGLHWTRASIRQHVRMLDFSNAGHHVYYHNARWGVPAALRHFSFDAVLLHNTVLGLRWHDVYPRFSRELDWLRHVDCLKIAFPQDEYDYAWVLDEWLDRLGVQVVFTQFDGECRQQLYPILSTKAQFVPCLTGYVDEPKATAIGPLLKPTTARPLDIVYRARHLPYWYGQHGMLKHQIAEAVTLKAAELGLCCDISTRPADTILGDRWYAFLASGKATIGCESGSSVLDRRGEVQREIKALLARDRQLGYSEVSDRLPSGWDRYRFFALGPRHLEAVLTKTCQLLVEGDYSGVLMPHRHYIPIRRDFANLGEVLSSVRDAARMQQIADQAYEDILLSRRYTYASLAAHVDAVVAPLLVDRTRGSWRMARVSLAALKVCVGSAVFFRKLPGALLRRLRTFRPIQRRLAA